MKIGFIGLGIMGRGMAANLQKAGYSLVVHDLTVDAAMQLIASGAVWADTPAALASACEVVFTSLPTPADVEAVAWGEQGLAKGFREGTAWFDLSTNAVDVVRAIHARLLKQGVQFLDAPVSGGPAGAASGKMAIWVGGDEATFERHKPILDSMSHQTRHIGPIGAGSVAKLTHNMASIAIGTVVTEVFTMGVKAGVEPLALLQAIRDGVTGRQRSFDKLALFLPGQFDPPNFQLRLAHKDVSLALQLGREVGVPMRMCTLAQQELTEALNRGWGARDTYAYMLLQQERSGLPKFEIPAEQVKAVVEAP